MHGLEDDNKTQLGERKRIRDERGNMSLVSEMTPYVSGAVGAYGTAVLVRARDEAADATVGLRRASCSGSSGLAGRGKSCPAT